MPGLVIFDCDGVLVDSEMIGCRTEAAVFAEAGFPIEAEEIRRRFIGMSFKDQIAVLERERGWRLPPELIDRVRKTNTAVFARELTAIPGILDALDAIAGPVCVASSSLPERIHNSLGLVGLIDRFWPNVFSSAMVARGKPAPDLFLYAAESMGVAAADCVVIEDSVYGIAAALAAGMRALGFAGGSHCDPEHGPRLAEAGAHLVFTDMRQLPRLIAAGEP
ncbi:MAG: HAD family hydrolase [Proteobacteria bacterium]|nr:HAD family hydrolase [Pseudomonadota bacterium]